MNTGIWKMPAAYGSISIELWNRGLTSYDEAAQAPHQSIGLTHTTNDAPPGDYKLVSDTTVANTDNHLCTRIEKDWFLTYGLKLGIEGNQQEKFKKELMDAQSK